MSVKDVALELELGLAVELIAREKGIVLDNTTIKRLSEKAQGILNEMGVVQEVISDAVDIAQNEWELEEGLKPEDLVVGEMYVVRDVPGIHYKARNKTLEFVGYQDMSGPRPILQNAKGDQFMILPGAGALKKPA